MKTTHFGFKSIATERKPQAVDAVFDSVARRYDLMNDLMSVGLHRLWKRHVVAQMGIRPGMAVLDLAGGTGDLTRRIEERLEGKGQVWLADVNGSMLRLGRDRLLDRGLIVPLVQCDAEDLPFPDGLFDRVVVAFGLRNMTRKDRAIAEAHRVLASGGKLFILEFSRIDSRLQKPYDLYSFNLLPRLGKWLVDDADSYRYLVESIRVHPDQAALRQMMIDQGFDHVSYENLSAGIVAIHRGVRR